MEEQLVSVIIPAYNAERYIKKSLMSVLDSTFKELKLLLLMMEARMEQWML